MGFINQLITGGPPSCMLSEYFKFWRFSDEVSARIDEVRRERRSAILGLTGLILCAILAADVALAVGRVCQNTGYYWMMWIPRNGWEHVREKIYWAPSLCMVFCRCSLWIQQKNMFWLCILCWLLGAWARSLKAGSCVFFWPASHNHQASSCLCAGLWLESVHSFWFMDWMMNIWCTNLVPSGNLT